MGRLVEIEGSRGAKGALTEVATSPGAQRAPEPDATDAHSVADASHVFIVGLPRTGTHLMRDVLHGSGEVGIGPESRFMGGAPRFGLIARPGLDLVFRRARGTLSEREARQLVEAIFSPKAHGLWRDGFWQSLARKEEPEVFVEAFLQTQRRAQDLLDLALKVHANGRRIPGDKTPSNLFYVPTLLEWFPHARVIHMFRDPRATYASAMRKGWIGPERFHLPAVTPLRLEIGVWTGIDHARRWRIAADLDDSYRARYPDRYLLCRFEDLVEEPEPIVRRVAEFVGVPYLPQMLERRVVSSSFMERGTTGIRPEATDRWRTELHPLLARWVSVLCGSRLERYGYTPR